VFSLQSLFEPILFDPNYHIIFRRDCVYMKHSATFTIFRNKWKNLPASASST
jgi:hypothetical protein